MSKFAGPGPGKFKELNPTAEELFNIEIESWWCIQCGTEGPNEEHYTFSEHWREEHNDG